MNVESLAVAGKYLIFILSAMIAAVAFWDEMRHKYIVVLLVAVVDLIYYLSAAKFYCVLKDLSEMIDRMVDDIFEERPFLEFKEADDGIFSKICGRLEKLYAAKAIAVKNMKQEVSVTH